MSVDYFYFLSALQREWNYTRRVPFCVVSATHIHSSRDCDLCSQGNKYIHNVCLQKITKIHSLDSLHFHYLSTTNLQTGQRHVRESIEIWVFTTNVAVSSISNCALCKEFEHRSNSRIKKTRTSLLIFYFLKIILLFNKMAQSQESSLYMMCFDYLLTKNTRRGSVKPSCLTKRFLVGDQASISGLISTGVWRKGQ